MMLRKDGIRCGGPYKFKTYQNETVTGNMQLENP